MIQTRNLRIALLLALSPLAFGPGATVLGQGEQMINIRPTLPPVGEGLSPADVAVSRKRVRVGEWVTVTLAAPVGVSRPRFHVNFGDGIRQETTSTQIDHQYRNVGHYDVYAWIVPAKEIPRLPPSVSLSANPTRVEVKRPVRFAARINSDYPGLKYRFVFGDGEKTGWNDEAYAAHAYDVANTYQAHVDIGGLENGTFKQLTESSRYPIVVNFRPQDSVDLLVGPKAEVGEQVTFTALTYSKDPKTSYRFVFGDGAESGWQQSTKVTHKYASATTYYAYVEMISGSFAANQGTLQSGKKAIQVVPRQRVSVSVDLIVKPAKPDTDTPVNFTAQVNSKDPNLRFRFFYGDGSSSKWQSALELQHKFSLAGSYSAYVEAGLANNNQRAATVLDTSPRREVIVAGPTPTPAPTPTASPTATPVGSPTPSPGSSPDSSPAPSPGDSPGSLSSSPSPSPGPTPILSPGSSPVVPPGGRTDSFPWWWLLLLPLLGVGYWAFKALFVPRPTFSARRDAGSSEVDAAKGLAIESQILLKPNIADGQYRVGVDEGNFIQSVRREND